MGATNHTTHYNMSQFIGTDKPSWLNDYNNDMSLIDTAIYNAADAANTAESTATAASNTATSAANTANTLNTQINTAGTGLAAVVSGHTTSIGTINGQIGNSFPLDTTAQTLSGAINELAQGGGGGGSTPGTLVYLGTYTLSANFDGSKTIKQAMEEVYTALVTYISGLAADEYIRIISGTYYTKTIDVEMICNDQRYIQSAPTSVYLDYFAVGNTSATIYHTKFAASAYANVGTLASSYSYTSDGATVGDAGYNSHLTIEKYKVLT